MPATFGIRLFKRGKVPKVIERSPEWEVNPVEDWKLCSKVSINHKNQDEELTI
jgi:hypothetical protein